MKYSRIYLVVFIFAIQVTDLLAGPGGKIAKVIFKSPLGKIVAIIIGVVLLPFIIYFYLKEYFAVSKTKKALKELALINHNLFDEVILKNRVTDIFNMVHKGWSDQNVIDYTDYMSNWYRQNQQMIYIDKWKDEGFINICNVKKINNINPLHIRMPNNKDYEGTRIMYLISANMEDYLVNVDNSAIIEGDKGFHDVETVWTIVLVDGIWKVDNIEESEMALTYAKMENVLSFEKLEVGKKETV